MMKFFKCGNGCLVLPVTNCYLSEDVISSADEITPNSVEAATEKHMPVVSRSGDTITVNVGSAPHPMTEEHSITTVFLETQNGGQYKFLSHDGEPITHFTVSSEDKPLAVYAYCNLHGMWKVDMD